MGADYWRGKGGVQLEGKGEVRGRLEYGCQLVAMGGGGGRAQESLFLNLPEEK